VSPDAKALVGGLAIGERDLLSPEMAENMKTLSLTHLVAVSGANLAIVMGVVYLLTAACALSRNTRFVTALLVMVAYVLVVGPESSVLRSATMATSSWLVFGLDADEANNLVGLGGNLLTGNRSWSSN